MPVPSQQVSYNSVYGEEAGVRGKELLNSNRQLRTKNNAALAEAAAAAMEDCHISVRH